MSLAKTRKHIYEQMILLSKGKVAVDSVAVQIKAANHVISSFETEIKAIQLANELRLNNSDYSATRNAILID
jgi:hypothetical protein